MKKYVLIIATMFFILFSNGCQKSTNSDVIPKEHMTMPTPSSNEKNDNITYELVSNNTHWEYRFYSPDHKNVIREIFYPDDDISHGYIDTKLYINNLDNYITDANYMDVFNKDTKTRAIWINNSKVLISGTYILDINDNSTEPIDFNGILKEDQWISNYRINTLKNQIAYVFSGKDQIEEVYLYDISSKEWNLIYHESHSWEPGTPYGASIFQVFWDCDDNLYFDTLDNNNQMIVKYNPSTKEMNTFKDGYKLQSSSPDNKYFILSYFDDKEYKDKLILLDLVNNKAINEFTGKYSWSNEKNLTLAIQNSTCISILLVHDNVITKKIIPQETNNDGSNIGYIDFYDKHFNFYLFKEDSGDIYKINY